MSNEIEIKLAVSDQAFNELEEHLKNFTCLVHKKQFLSNTYYDYPDHFLAKQKNKEIKKTSSAAQKKSQT